MKKFMTASFILILAIIFTIFYACRDRSIGTPAPEPTNTPTPTRTPTPTHTATPLQITGLIDDFADCNGSNVYGGAWFAYGDSNNTFTNPPPTVTPGYNGSDCALKFEGVAAASCGYGVWMSNSLLSGATVDLSGNTVISFYAKGSGTYRIVLISPITQYNDYQYVFSAPSSWSQIVIPFTSFTQPQNFNLAPIQQALSGVTNISFANGSCGMTINLLIDEVRVY
ncbi:MAG: hypothetical protein N3E50_09300 [Candidatus Goldbacteria bacterium]|nr:hypothetical protein [Candidatus Goldiibacteriota bacterium]